MTSAPSPDVATRTEALGLLTELARERRTQAVIALAKELREGAADDALAKELREGAADDALGWIMEAGR